MARTPKVKINDTRSPHKSNEDLIRGMIVEHKLFESDDNDMILELLLHQQHNLDAIQDDKARNKLCAKRGWSEPTEAERIEFCIDTVGKGESIRQRDFRSCMSDNREKLTDRKKYHRLRKTRLMEQIRKCRYLVTRAQIQAERAQEFVEDAGEAGATDWTKVESRPLTRISTGLASLDKICGVTPAHTCEDTGEHILEKWGPVIGKVYAMAAPQGMGKTRLMTKIMSKMCGVRGKTEGDYSQRFGGMQGVYFQAEATKADFVSTFVRNVWTEGETKVSIAGDTLLAEHERVIREIRPEIVVIDSKDMLYEFKTGSLLENAIKMYKHWAVELGFVLFIISHVNQKGGLKGRTEFGHAVDAVMVGARSPHDSDLFSLAFTKNRMGRVKQEVWFKHTTDSVEEWDHSLIETEINPGLAILLADIDPDNDAPQEDDAEMVAL